MRKSYLQLLLDDPNGWDKITFGSLLKTHNIDLRNVGRTQQEVVEEEHDSTEYELSATHRKVVNDVHNYRLSKALAKLVDSSTKLADPSRENFVELLKKKHPIPSNHDLQAKVRLMDKKDEMELQRPIDTMVVTTDDVESLVSDMKLGVSPGVDLCNAEILILWEQGFTKETLKGIAKATKLS